jgi:hypothetical protein
VHFPAVSPDGQTLLFTYFDRRGTELKRIRYAPQEEKEWAQEDRSGWYDQFRKPPPAGEKAEKARRFGVDYLMGPLSSTSFAIPGLDLQVGDLEAENVFALSLAGASARAWMGQAVYRNTRWWPTVGAAIDGQSFGSLRTASAGAFVELPFPLLVQAGWRARETHEFDADVRDPHAFDSGPTAALFFSNLTGVQPRDPSWGFAIGGSVAWFREGLGGDRDLAEYTGVVETSLALAQDWLLWLRADETKKVGPLLSSEVLEIKSAVRGATDMDGTDLGRVTLELRFPIWRDLFFMPLEILGLGEYLLVKDLRGFLFGDAGFAGLEIGDANREHGAASAGAGLRVDLFGFAWPVINVRVPVRLEIWFARVGQGGRGPEDDVGFGFVLGY